MRQILRFQVEERLKSRIVNRVQNHADVSHMLTITQKHRTNDDLIARKQ